MWKALSLNASATQLIGSIARLAFKSANNSKRKFSTVTPFAKHNTNICTSHQTLIPAFSKCFQPKSSRTSPTFFRPFCNIPEITKEFEEKKDVLEAKARSYISTILKSSMQMKPEEKMLVIYDTQCDLSPLLARAYAPQRENTISMDFDATTPETIKSTIDSMNKGDLVVLIQTGAFRLNEYRFRLELFNREMKTIEHVHLGLLDPDQYETYINALNFDPREKGKIAYKLKHKLDVTKKITVVSSGGCELTYESEMEPALLNIGDYSAMKNVGGTFPVGEVFSEPKDLSKVNGEVMVWGFPNTSRVMDIFDIPFKVKIEKGVISSIDADAPTSFKEITDIIKNAEGEILVREFGLGLNSAMSKQNPVSDVTAFERQEGLHLSLGKKHTVFKKPGISTKERFHIDMFVDVQQIIADGETIYSQPNGFL